ncbi:hypothetical protein Tco_1013587 [Tanacetum coccineum]
MEYHLPKRRMSSLKEKGAHNHDKEINHAAKREQDVEELRKVCCGNTNGTRPFHGCHQANHMKLSKKVIVSSYKYSKLCRKRDIKKRDKNKSKNYKHKKQRERKELDETVKVKKSTEKSTPTKSKSTPRS